MSWRLTKMNWRLTKMLEYLSSTASGMTLYRLKSKTLNGVSCSPADHPLATLIEKRVSFRSGAQKIQGHDCRATTRDMHRRSSCTTKCSQTPRLGFYPNTGRFRIFPAGKSCCKWPKKSFKTEKMDPEAKYIPGRGQFDHVSKLKYCKSHVPFNS